MLDTQTTETTSNLSSSHDSFLPQQRNARQREQAEAAGALIIASAGEDASREGLLRTPTGSPKPLTIYWVATTKTSLMW